MSDGPHRSLPLRRHWRDLAERTAKLAFSIEEVAEALPHALRMEVREIPLGEIRDILGGGDQGSLFGDDRATQLEAARDACRGSAIGTVLIDCAIEAVVSGFNGAEACELALTAALEEHSRSTARSTEEHYLRENASQRSVANVRSRMAGAMQACDFRALAREMLGVNRGSSPSRLPRHVGIDEGPPL